MGWTRSEIINATAAVGTIFSAIFAASAVYMSYSQIKSQFDLMNRTEKLKALSDFSVATRAFCQDLVPSEFQDGIRMVGVKSDGQIIPPAQMFEIYPEKKWTSDEIYKIAMNSKSQWQKSKINVSNKAYLLSIWLEDREKASQFLLSTGALLKKVPSNLSKPRTEILDEISTSYSKCENFINLTVKEMSQ